ncbi:MAG: CCA tRNA nucleotidyltransferase [Clostridia bacterium]|nr:CCA tRNA nucleotidyltransferase [Clostridia bacterium]
MIKLPSGAEFIIKRLEENGKAGHIVGGSVRDFLLSKNAVDYDITTNATPDEMKTIFFDQKTIETGIKHGTLTVIADEMPYEVTTYRVDGEYENHRRPKSVSFTSSLYEDLARRDFTMNAIAYNENDGFIDKFDGISDIENKIIRAVGIPEIRFEEDALRILRAIRFSATLGFEIEECTSRAAFSKAHLLRSVSAERIYTEWKKLLSGMYSYDVIEKYKVIISEYIIGENLPVLDKKRFLDTNPNVRELAFFAATGESAAARFADFCGRMKTDSKTKRIGVSALECLNMPIDSEADMNLLVIKAGAESSILAVELKILLFGENVEKRERLTAVLNSDAPFSVKELQICGDDAAALGYRGKKIGEILNQTLISVAKGEIKNDREALLRFLSEEVKE